MLEVKYFPNKTPQGGFIGGGYIITEYLKINFRVRDGQYGIWVILPSQKKPDSNEYFELVQFVNKEAKDFITKKVEEAIANQVERPAPPQSSAPQSSGDNNAPKVMKRNVTGSSGTPSKLPWE